MLDRARAAAEAYRWTPAWKRSAILERTSHLIEENAEQIARIIAAEGGKPLKDARVEAKRGASTFRWAGEEAKRTAGDLVEMDADPSGEDRFGWTIREPRGVIAAISPFNFPLNLVAHKVAPALAGGNAVVLKPASNTPLTALRLAELLAEAGLPDGVLQVVVGSGRTIGNKMVTDERTNMVSFTGSPPVGRQIASDAGMKMVTLELGNNSATIVDEDANLDLAVQRVVAGGFANSGQICISVQRVVVHQAVYDAVHGEARPRGRGAQGRRPARRDHRRGHAHQRGRGRAGQGLDRGGRGAGRDARHRRRARRRPPAADRAHRRDARDEGLRREVFGPVLSILKARDLCEAIDISNDSEMGLQAGVFTNDLNKAMYAARRLEVGRRHDQRGPDVPG